MPEELLAKSKRGLNIDRQAQLADKHLVKYFGLHSSTAGWYPVITGQKRSDSRAK